jgi:hypothetical protein
MMEAAMGLGLGGDITPQEESLRPVFFEQKGEEHVDGRAELQALVQDLAKVISVENTKAQERFIQGCYGFIAQQLKHKGHRQTWFKFGSALLTGLSSAHEPDQAPDYTAKELESYRNMLFGVNLFVSGYGALGTAARGALDTTCTIDDIWGALGTLLREGQMVEILENGEVEISYATVVPFDPHHKSRLGSFGG